MNVFKLYITFVLHMYLLDVDKLMSLLFQFDVYVVVVLMVHIVHVDMYKTDAIYFVHRYINNRFGHHKWNHFLLLGSLNTSASMFL
jgi:hypothetical protein